MTKEQQIVWDRLKHGVPKRFSAEFAFIEMGRAMGKTALSMQAFGRAMRNVNALEKSTKRNAD